MDNTFDENDFIENQDLHAREIQTGSDKSQKNTTNRIWKEPPADDTGEVMDFRKFWESRYGRELSEFELQECRDNIAGIFNLLAEWDKDYE